MSIAYETSESHAGIKPPQDRNGEEINKMKHTSNSKIYSVLNAEL